MAKKVLVRQSAIFEAEQFNPPNEIPKGVSLHKSTPELGKDSTDAEYFGRVDTNKTVYPTDWVLRQGIGVNQTVTVVTQYQFTKNFVRVESALFDNGNT